MKYQELIVIYSIKYQFAENNIDIVIRFLVNKYNYLLKNMINSIPENVNVEELDYEPVSNMIENMLLSILFPYIIDFNPNMESKIHDYFNRYITYVSIDLFNKNKDISRKNINFIENDLVVKFKSIFSMNESYWDNIIKSFLKKNGKILGNLSSYFYDCHWNKNINEIRKNCLSDKIDKLYEKLTKKFSSFFAYGEYINIEDTYDLTNQFISNYSKVYPLYYELSKYIDSDDIIMIIISKANILND
jgi:hypothetical protein